MDPYYQQQQQQQQHGAGPIPVSMDGGLQMASAGHHQVPPVGGPQQQPASHHQQSMHSRAPPVAYGSHQQQQHQQQVGAPLDQAAGYTSQRGTLSYGGAPSGQAAVTTPAGGPVAGHHHHHYPAAQAGASGGARYSGHRSAAHQHRMSAAAISDPMMGGGITEQLAFASGPYTGSGSALNQLAGSGAYYPGDYSVSAAPGATGYHHSSGNLLAGSSRARYHQSTTAGYEGARSADLADHQRYYPSAPPAPDRYTGLGPYNPLDDPLARPAAPPPPGALASEPYLQHQQQQQQQQAGLQELRARLQEAQSGYAAVKRELEATTQKLGSSMHSIRSFWSPELKKERALRKEEATKYALINEQMKLMRVEVQKQALLIRQLEEELRLAHETRLRTGNQDVQQHIDALCMEKEALFKENCLLKETVRELEMRIETQKQTLAARDDSIRKMVEMMNNKGIASKIMDEERLEADRIKTRNIELEARLRHYESIIETKEKDVIKYASTSGFKTQPIGHQASSSHLSLRLNSPKPRQRKSASSSLKKRSNHHQKPTETRTKSLLSSNNDTSLICEPSSSVGSRDQATLQDLQQRSSQDYSALPPSKEKLTEAEYTLQSSSSGVSSSRSCSGELYQHNHQVFNNGSVDYRLCQCSDCRQSGQQIYSRGTTRKAVSFRADVEHIGSPQPNAAQHNINHLNDVAYPVGSDSMPIQISDNHWDSDYLRPLDCSTPNQDDTSNEQLLRVELHPQPKHSIQPQPTSSQTLSAPNKRPAMQLRSTHPPVATCRLPQQHQHQDPSQAQVITDRLQAKQGTSAICLCSPDFLCQHNYPVPPQSVSNDLYGNLSGVSYSSRRNPPSMQTYANLSSINGSSASTSNQNKTIAHRRELSAASSTTNGYGTSEYRRLLMDRQDDLYGSRLSGEGPAEYLTAAARRLQQTLDNCDMCKQQMASVSMASQPQPQPQSQPQLQLPQQQPECSCPKQEDQITLLDVSNSSYKTAQSSSIQEALANASQLSVLPLHQTPAARTQTLQQYSNQPELGNQKLATTNGNESSLSSLFVYRHASDDNQEPEVDSLETQVNNSRYQVPISQNNKQQPPVIQQTSVRGAGGEGSGWLKARPKSEYISLSSTTSSQSNTLPSNNGHRNQRMRASNDSRAFKSAQVDSDLSHSSLAKRRLNALNRANSRSSPNLNSQAARSAAKGEKYTSNMRSFYQSFKNHLLQNIKPSSGGNRHTQSLSAGSSASLPRSLSGPTKSRSTSGKTAQMEELRGELARRDQELLTVAAKMKALEEQLRDSQRHIHVLKDSLVAKEEHYNLLLADVDELRKNLDERNKLLEKRSFQQRSGADPLYGSSPYKGSVMNKGPGYQQEVQEMLEMRDKKIAELQRKMMQLDGLLKERESQLDRLRLDHGGSSSHADPALLSHLEQTIGDREKQLSLIRDQRDRAEHDLNEERDSHERSIKEYKMKLNSVKFEMEKLQNRLGGKADSLGTASSKYLAGNDPLDQAALIKRLELDKRSLQLECERLRDRVEAGFGPDHSGGLNRRTLDNRPNSAIGDYSMLEFERLQESLESQKQELRRAQAESRMNEMERKRAQEEADKLSERYERAQNELHKLKARLENATSEREQLLEDYERQQQLISKCQSERDSALADINQLKLNYDRLQQSSNKNQLQAEKLQAQLERNQLEYKRLEDRLSSTLEELHELESEKSASQRQLKTLELNLQSAQMQQQRLQQEKEQARHDLEKVQEKHERLDGELERYLQDKELHQQQLALYKERLESQQQQSNKWLKEREALTGELQELKERLVKQQRMQESSEQEARHEARAWKEKYERLMVQYEKLGQDMLAKEKESQLVIKKVQQMQSDTVSLEAKLEQSEMERERTALEVEKLQQASLKAKEEYKRWQDESSQLQEMYTKTNTKLLKLSEVEEKLRIDYDKCQMDLEVLRERYEKLQVESRKLQSERDRLQVEHERIRYDNERIQQSQGSQQATQDDFIRLSSELERSVAKLDQYQREINKLQLERERLLLDSKAALQQSEQQYQQQLVKLKSNEERALLELERSRHQVEKLQVRCEQDSGDQEKMGADKERLRQQLLLLQQEVDKFKSQQSTSMQETKKLHEEELQRLLHELEIVRDKYGQQRKELLQLREAQQNHELDKDILRRELDSAQARLDKLSKTDSKQKQDSERCMIELEKMRDKIERKQQELARTQKERNQFAQEITVLHQQIQQLQLHCDQTATTPSPTSSSQQPHPQQPTSPQQATQQAKQVEGAAKLREMLLKSESDLQKSLAENQRFQMELEQLKLQLDNAAEYIGNIEADNKSLQAQNQELIQQLKQQATSQVMSQQPQQQAKQMSQAKAGASEQQLKELQDVIQNSTMELQRMGDERKRLQEANADLNRQLAKTKSDFNSTVSQFEAEIGKLKQQQASSSEATNKVDEYKVKFEKAVEAIRAFQKTSDDMKKEIIKLNERNKGLTDQNQSLIKSLQQQQQQSQPEAVPTQEVQAEQQQLRQQLAQMKEMCAKMDAELAATRQETQKHSGLNEKLRQELSATGSQMANLKTDRDRLEEQLERLMQELQRKEAELEKLQSKQDKTGSGLEEKQAELASIQRQLEEREKALEAKRAELQSLAKLPQQQQELIGKLQQQVKVLEEDRNKLRGELERCRNDLKQSQTELERLLKILTASEEDKFNLTQQIDQLQSKLKAAQPAAQTAASNQKPPGDQRTTTVAAANQQQLQQPQKSAPQTTPQQKPNQQPPQQQPPKPAGQSSFFSIKDNMEMLETALKQSINQCLRGKADTTSEQQSRVSGLADAIELRLREESQTRAFITQFKIQLNNLMGLKWIGADGDDACGCDDESEDEGGGTRFLAQMLDETENCRRQGPGIIKLNCRHNGLYKINEQHHEQANNSSADCILNSLETQVDDGYRSMNQCNFKNSIIHQLNEIKSRLIDLVHEIDEKVESRLSDVELDCYRRRRNILIEKLDMLLDILSGRSSDTSRFSLPNSIVSSDGASSQRSSKALPEANNNARKLLNGFSMQLTGNYEEQEQIINYSDSSHSSNSSLHDTSIGQADKVEDAPIYSRIKPINGHANRLLNHSSLKKRPLKHSSLGNQQHMPSSSTTSTYSTSSHTSSSSFL